MTAVFDSFAHETRTPWSGLAAEATREKGLDGPGRGQNGDGWIVQDGQVPIAADHGSGARHLREGEEVVVVRVPADGRNVRRVRNAMAAVGDLGDEGSRLVGGCVPAELGAPKDRGQLARSRGQRRSGGARRPPSATTEPGSPEE